MKSELGSVVAAAFAVTGLFTIDAGAGAASTRPDLALISLSRVPASVVPGTPLGVSYRVKNKGSTRARRSTTRFYLSKDRRRGRDDRRLATKAAVKALRPNRAARKRTELAIPAATPPGAYHLIACADAARKLKEAKERNNCRASRAFDLTEPAVPPGPGIPGGGDLAPGPPGPGGPLDVGIRVDAARAVTKRLGSAGGSVAVTAANGTEMTLMLPADALLDDVDITVTPLAGIDGLPFSGGLIGGVDLAPHGLRLQVPATLRIEPPAPVPLNEQAPFAYLENGEDFHSAPTTLDPGVLDLPISHFSGGGAARGTDAERDAQQQRQPRDSSAQTTQDLAEAVEDFRTGKLDRDAFDDLVEQILRRHYQELLRPLMDAAKTDDSLALPVLQAVKNWLWQVENGFSLSARFGAEIAEARKAEAEILKFAFGKAHERCLAHDIAQVARIIALGRIGEIEGIELPDAKQKIDECVRFELDFEAIITNEVPGLGRFMQAHVRVQDLEIRVDFDAAGGLRLLGEKALEYVSYERWDEGTCVELFELKVGEPFTVVDLDPDPNVYEDANQPRQVVLNISPGTSAEQFETTACDDPGSGRSYLTRFVYYAGFANLHAAEHAAKPCPPVEAGWGESAPLPPPPELPGFIIRDFDTPGGTLFARASFDRRVDSCDELAEFYDGTTDFLLWHRPASG